MSQTHRIVSTLYTCSLCARYVASFFSYNLRLWLFNHVIFFSIMPYSLMHGVYFDWLKWGLLHFNFCHVISINPELLLSQFHCFMSYWYWSNSHHHQALCCPSIRCLRLLISSRPDFLWVLQMETMISVQRALYCIVPWGQAVMSGID